MDDDTAAAMRALGVAYWQRGAIQLMVNARYEALADAHVALATAGETCRSRPGSLALPLAVAGC
eukprot:scaffold4317_cov323-Prasinococcus_capsulatus_cf.AAC.4